MTLRRQAILNSAAEVFQETGFNRTSIAGICQRVGYSKATHEALDPTMEDIHQALSSFGTRLLTLLYSPQVQAVRRLVVSEAGRSDLGKNELSPKFRLPEVT
ncbi:hypothetical protein GCM10027343_36940 [Noviherbaspirillum agri]